MNHDYADGCGFAIFMGLIAAIILIPVSIIYFAFIADPIHETNCKYEGGHYDRDTDTCSFYIVIP